MTELSQSGGNGDVGDCDGSIDGNGDGDSRGAGDGTTNRYIKTERMISGIHFLTDQEEDERAELLVPKSEANDTEPEVKKQVGCITANSQTRGASGKRYDKMRNWRI